MPWLTSKTNKLAVGTIFGAIASLLLGAIDPATAIQTGIGALLAIFMRQGIEKSGPNGKK